MCVLGMRWCVCVSASVCLSVLEVSLPPIGRLAPSERVGRGFKDFFGTRGGEGGNGLLGKGGKTLSCLPPPPWRDKLLTIDAFAIFSIGTKICCC